MSLSRGPGRTQVAILKALDKRPNSFLTTAQLARRLERSQQQVYRAARALADRGLVELSLEPELRVWLPGATARRRSYAHSIDAKWPQLRRPGHCGPGCQEHHVGADKQHWA
jgi:hypothetical protein